MLSFYSEKAVAAVGLINQYVFFIQLMYLMVALGASILLAQYLGSGDKETAHKTAVASFALGTIFAVVLSLTLALGAPGLMSLYGLEPAVHDYALQFLVIYSSCSVFTAYSMLQSTLLRVHGETRAPMYINMAANVINILGNAISLFGWFGLPVLGVVGVASATVFAQAAAALALQVVIRRRGIELNFRLLRVLRWPEYKKLLCVGVPTAGENISYNLAQIINMRFIAMLGTNSMAAYVFLTSFLRYVFVSSISIGQATQIKVGWWIGNGNEEIAAKKAMRYFVLGSSISLVLVVALNLSQGLLFRIFTQNPDILKLCGTVLLVSLLLEPARNFNVIIIPALKGAGDVRYPVAVGVVFMWLIGVLGSWFLGIVLGWGLVGIYMALCADEWTRGLFMLTRWKSGRWRGRGFVKRVPS